MKTKKKIIISTLLCSAVLVPIIGLIASCKNEQQQSVNQNQVLVNKEDNKTKSNDKKTNSKLDDQSKLKAQSLVDKSTLSKQKNNSVVDSQPKQNSLEANKVGEGFDPTKTNAPLVPTTLSEQEVKTRILSTKHLAVNYYSHPDFKLESNYVTVLGGNDDSKKQPAKLQLLTSDDKVVDGVRWFIRVRYPDDQVFSSETKIENGIIDLKKDGTVYGLSYEGNDKVADVWAEYQGYLYKAQVRVYSNSETINELEMIQTREAAKEITKDWHHLSDFQKALKAYEWMTKNVKYVVRGDLVSDQTPYSSLVEKACVCSGYAKGYKMLLDELNVPSRLLVGPVFKEYHIWNLVEIQGKWYHVDPTWGAKNATKRANKEQETIYNYFLLLDEDFAMGRQFNNPFTKEQMGTKYRGAKMKNFAIDETDIKRVVHKTFAKKGENDKWVSILTPWQFNNSQYLEKIIKQETGTNIKPNEGRFSIRKNNFRDYRFILEKPLNKTNFKQENLSISTTANSFSDYIIKIKANKEIKLGLENIEVENAFVDKFEETIDGYLVYLTNFDKPNGLNNIKIDIFKIGYDFSLDKSELTFNVLQQDKPKAEFKATSNSSAILFNVNSSMQYRTIIGDWVDITSNQVEFNNIGTLDILVRKKADAKHMVSNIQYIDVSKARDIYNDVKYVNNQLIGVDSSMEYKLVNSSEWKDITSNRLVGLKPGTYEVRIKPNGTQLASDPTQIVVS
ncbi:hypothetical protein JM47_00840 [Ureaplasma diversum]|uniref:Transglutaminase-like domain-containing protein n=1 Tax=Ureaplasma diversum TaxID=42094 RepID=A0A0C5RNY8_9BACT|nr:transglutaminase domain-containing protein [Ureaplasma diversum]AJQ45189.1 hypothetical protein JM47_00840 [Ureaplasma diversum]